MKPLPMSSIWAAGIKQDAYPKNSSIERYNANGLKTIINVDLTSDKGNNTVAKAGDYIRVKSASNQYEECYHCDWCCSSPW